MVRKLKITKEITLDVSRLNRFQSIIAKQNDKDSRYLKVSVADEGNVLIIPSTAEVTITATRPDKLSSSFLGKISEDGKAIVPLSPWMLELDGSLSCEVSIITEESVLKTTSFYVDVEPDESSGNTDVTQDPNYDILVELIQEVSGVAAIEKEAISTAVDAYLHEKNIRPLQKGVDYWTPEDKTEIINDVKDGIPFVKTAEQPTFVNSVDEMTDTSKVYVMPNGNIWAYAKGIVENKVNQYKSDTAQFNVRYNQNTGEMSTTRGFVLVEVDGLDFTAKSEYIVRFSGETLVRHTNLGVYGQVTFFNGSEFSSTKWIYSTANANSIAFTQDDIGYYVDLMDAAPDTNITKCYFAICLADNTTISAADCDNLFIEFVPLTTYTEEYAWRDTGISYVQYIPTDNDFNNIAEKVNKKINATIYVDGESGDDTKAGSQDSPLKTIQKAIDSGAKTIYCKAGTYNENINLNNVHGVKIIGQWETYESGKRPKVRIDHSTTLTPTDNGNGLKIIALSADLYKYEHPLLYNVFVTKQYQPTIGSGVTIGYVVSLWNVTDERVSTHYKLVPVMTLEECQSTAETFFYDGTTIYIHSTGSVFKMVSANKYNKVESCSDVVFEDIAFDYCYYDALAVNNSNDIVFRNCEFSHSSTACGVATNNMNGEFYNCEAYCNRTDGFNFHEFGETTIYNCIGAYNYDDGISHHDGCTGSIHGGQYHHNGKGGVSSPTYGAVIDIYNAVMHDNQYGIYAVGCTADRQIIVNGCYIHNNTYGIVSPQYELLVIHSTLIDNSTNTSGNVTVIGSTGTITT